MITLKKTYENRMDEINKFIGLMKFLEHKKIMTNEDEISFDEFFSDLKSERCLSYQELINILKSNLALMIYNVVEYTVTALIDCIYDEIRMQKLSYVDVNTEIRTLWRKTSLKQARDPNASFNTLLKANERMIDLIVEKKTLDVRAKEVMPTGNLDSKSIKRTFDLHGLHITADEFGCRDNVLDNIKKQRNDLAHGAVSFVEAVRNESIQDYEDYARYVSKFLRELINAVEEYLKHSGYKRTTRRKYVTEIG